MTIQIIAMARLTFSEERSWPDVGRLPGIELYRKIAKQSPAFNGPPMISRIFPRKEEN
jgi:hypothetical protein